MPISSSALSSFTSAAAVVRPSVADAEKDPRLEGAAAESPSEHAPASPGGLELSPELDEAARAVVAEMAARDQEVRAHEAAHAGTGGSLAGAPSYTYETGPDGKRYAVAGEVAISLGGGGSPAERAVNARQARAAALAPAKPSGADRAIAAQASRIEAAARAEMAQEARGEAAEQSEGVETDAAGGPTGADARGETEHATGKAVDADAKAVEAERAARSERIAAAYHQHPDGGDCRFCQGEPSSNPVTM